MIKGQIIGKSFTKNEITVNCLYILNTESDNVYLFISIHLYLKKYQSA